MRGLHSTYTQEFNNSFEEAVQIVDGPHPECAVQLLKILLNAERSSPDQQHVFDNGSFNTHC